jgi:hypothetical protein
MAKQSLLWMRMLGAMVLLLMVAGNARANIWLDEDFEGATAFEQRDGTVTGQNGWDTYSANFLLDPVTFSSGYTQSGSVNGDKSFLGVKSYRLLPEQSLVVGPEYQDAQNGNFQIFQFAVNVDPIPAEGTVGIFRWDHDMGSFDAEPDHSFYVRLESTGTVVNIFGGEDLANETPVEETLGTLTTSESWAYITVLIQKDNAATADSRFPLLGAVSQGAHFFNQSWTPAFSTPFLNPEPGAYAGRGWSFTVQSGAVFLDEMYWDGGLDNDAATSQFKPFDLGAVVPPSTSDWLYVD